MTERDFAYKLELAKQRMAIVERIMKLPYIKATRNASLGEERFVARDDIIQAVHDYAKLTRESGTESKPEGEGRAGLGS
jgi:hypothetical protein